MTDIEEIEAMLCKCAEDSSDIEICEIYHMVKYGILSMNSLLLTYYTLEMNFREIEDR